eukprot:TRINITY_DN2704_c1_g1_i1.p1 TRINITY_DN2704_c1_g1~~TRINITY_DN2704_c1_g1_i1.p1  ORF type:complete len:165 (+),score=25.60 TRINITY_DN2704_c1_g1_i1:43-537(+)
MPECPVCIREYVSTIPQRCPRVMVCGHTLCSVCIRKLATSRKTVSCPSCREVSKVPIKGFPTNFALVEALRESEARKALLLRRRPGCTRNNNTTPTQSRVPPTILAQKQHKQPSAARSKKSSPTQQQQQQHHQQQPPPQQTFSSSRCRTISNPVPHTTPFLHSP